MLNSEGFYIVLVECKMKVNNPFTCIQPSFLNQRTGSYFTIFQRIKIRYLSDIIVPSAPT